MSDLHDLAMKIRLDLPKIQIDVTELLRQVGELPDHQAKAKPRCPECGIERNGPRALAEHLTNVHGHEPATTPSGITTA